MRQKIVTVDSFNECPFGGNPAAVCVRDGPRDTAWMRDLARGMNLSETSCLHPESDADRLRWLTPTVEVALAATHVLREDGRFAARVLARGGVIRVRTRGPRVVLGGRAVTVLRGE